MRAFAILLALLLPALPAQADDAAVSAFWQRCQPRLDPPPPDGFYRTVQIGSAETAPAIMKLILAGEKVGTFTSPWLYEGDRSVTPTLGGYSLLTDFDGAPVAVLKTTGLITLPFTLISEDETAIDGPAVRPLAVWRRVHEAYFTRLLAGTGKAFAPDMPVTAERFVVVCN